ncbi:hypothetical protein [Streptomyces sp. V3I7]|uniref:hypothetical protein n=1 Tax=Streptomyces sp. V3I7 TaxID=3042278 RepID=UPI00278ACB0C|nr:hypothetical protein [Streptomyces sp. V3I7]MDQ0992036.1 hypothetical protein [Streptomyces sp. V3I7]
MLERKRPAIPASIRQYSDPLAQLSPADEALDWRRDAACARLPQQVIFARTPSVATPALRACNQCPIAARCEAAVEPSRSWFDGVCSGRLWRNGRVVADNRPFAGEWRESVPYDRETRAA